ALVCDRVRARRVDRRAIPRAPLLAPGRCREPALREDRALTEGLLIRAGNNKQVEETPLAPGSSPGQALSVGRRPESKGVLRLRCATLRTNVHTFYGSGQ